MSGLRDGIDDDLIQSVEIVTRYAVRKIGRTFDDEDIIYDDTYYDTLELAVEAIELEKERLRDKRGV